MRFVECWLALAILLFRLGSTQQQQQTCLYEFRSTELPFAKFHVAQLSRSLPCRNALLLHLPRPQMGRHPNSVPFFRSRVAVYRWVRKRKVKAV